MRKTDVLTTRLSQSNQRMKAISLALALALVVVLGLRFESSADARPDVFDDSVASDAVSVDDSAGFAVFVRQDGKLVIVHKNGRVIVTDGHPMAVGL